MKVVSSTCSQNMTQWDKNRCESVSESGLLKCLVESNQELREREMIGTEVIRKSGWRNGS